MRLSGHLALLACAAVTPIAVIAAILAVLLAMHERKQVDASLERLRLEFTAAFDRELGEIVDELVATGISNLPSQGDMRAVYERAVKAQAEHKDWVSTALIELPGRMIFDTTLPFGARTMAGDLGPLALQASQTGRPAISQTLAKDRAAGEETLAIALPSSLSIDHEEPNRYAICVRYRAVALNKAFGAVGVPPQWRVDLIDAAGMVIARSGMPGAVVGEKATPGLVQLAPGEHDTSLWEPTKDGSETFAVIGRIPRAHWSVVVALPANVYWAPVRQTAVWASVGGTAAAVLSAMLAVGIGRRISRPIDAAVRSSAALSRGGPFELDAPSRMTEIRELFGTFKNTASLISSQRAERNTAIADLENRSRYRDALARIYVLGWDETDLDVLLTKIAEQLGNFLAARACVIFREQAGVLDVQAATGWSAGAGMGVRVSARLEQVLTGAEIRPPRTWVFTESSADTFEQIAIAQGFRSALLIAIKELNRPYGILGWFFAQERELSVEDQFFAQAAAVMVGKRISELSVRELARTNAQLAAAVNSMDAGVAITDVTGADSRVIFINSGFTKVTGYLPEETAGRPPQFLADPDLDESEVKRLREAIAHGQPMTVTIPGHRKDGKPYWSEIHLSSIRDEAGEVQFIISIHTDVTARVEAEEALRQTMKMEALGKLTGGVAHDFNNILTVITGTIEILASAVADRPQLAAIAKMIGDAAARGSEITRRLLAFARKQPLQPQETDINALVRDTVNLLQPSLGAQTDIDVALEPDTWPALVDPSQLATALVNLSVNARDAMPNGGKLTFETGNVLLDESCVGENRDLLPGTYVMIAVTDTGTGIPAKIRDKIFEPFFTTKDERKGTGLGLSMVYGFVKQSGGSLKINSEEGRGTSVKIYLPRAGQYAVNFAPATLDNPSGASGEVILVVEDDTMVRNYVTAQLKSLGYQTVAAENAAEALGLVRRGLTFDLLFTDIVMPGSMDGSELARVVRGLRPSVKVLFTSGYTDKAIAGDGSLQPGVLLLQKPYRMGELARMIQTALRTDSVSWLGLEGASRESY
jgi:PAS domain S-box-containing protein